MYQSIIFMSNKNSCWPIPASNLTFPYHRLYPELREKAGLVYSVEVELEANQPRALYAIRYACDSDNVAKVHGIVKRNLMEMQTQRINPDGLLQAKLMLLRRIPLSESSLQSIAKELIKRSILDLPPDEPITATKDHGALTAEPVKVAFAKWVRPVDLVLGNSRAGSKGEIDHFENGS